MGGNKLSSLCFTFLIIYTFVVISANEVSKNSNNGTEEILQEQRMISLEGKLDSILKKFEQIIKTIDKQAKMIHKNIAEQKLEKTVLSLSLGEQSNANALWKETLTHIDENEIPQNLKQLIVSSYSKSRENFYPILEFLLKNKLYSGFPLLYGELANNDHIHGGAEIFVLAKSIIKVCGKASTLYKNLPKIVQTIVSGPVFIKNAENEGFLIAHDHKNCTKVSFYECNEGYPAQEVFLHKINIEGDLGEEEVLIDKRAQWEFVLPEDEDLQLPLSSGFLLKSVHSNEFVITKLSGASSFFLRENTTFSPYFAKHRQCQFLPQTDKAKETEDIRIGLKHKYVKNIDFFYADHFAKVQVLPLMKRDSVSDDKNEYFWSVIPVSEQELDRRRSSTVQTYPANCMF